MKTENNKPLYKVLNEQRTQDKQMGVKQKAEIEYTALAVNNLHILAEALEDIINEMEEKRKAVNPFFYNSFKKAKEVLNRIS